MKMKCLGLMFKRELNLDGTDRTLNASIKNEEIYKKAS